MSAEPSSVSEHPEPLRSLHQLVELVTREDDLATAEPLFRGEPKVFDTALVPKVFRPESQKHFALTRVKGSGMYTGQGHVPPVVAAVQALEHFKRLGLPYVPREPADDWEWLAIAQHHGLATPLLDWSRNPLCALFFAVESSNGGQESVLWRLDHRGRAAKLLSVGLNAGKAHVSKKSADPFQLDAVHVFLPMHSTARVISQNGIFTAHPPESMLATYTHGQLTRYRVPAEDRILLRDQLLRLNIHRAALFPDLDGVAAYLSGLDTFPGY